MTQKALGVDRVAAIVGHRHARHGVSNSKHMLYVLRLGRIAFLNAVLVFCGCGALQLPVQQPVSSSRTVRSPHSQRPLPANLRGITYDDISSTCSATPPQIQTERLLREPTIRVVLDRVAPNCYASSVTTLDRYGYTMGELIDSSDMKRYSLASVRKRVSAYLTNLGSSIDLWEIGNEVNGEWLSSVRCPSRRECAAQARDVVSKVIAMYDAVTAAGYATEMTLYYEPPQTVTPGYDMLAWERTYIPKSMHSGLRYILVSYYEGSNAGVRPTQAQWDVIFKQLAADFPNAKVGFGEIGLNKPIGAATLARATRIFTYYQTLSFPDVPSYTRAGFWWNAAEDLVPSTKWPSFFQTVARYL